MATEGACDELVVEQIEAILDRICTAQVRETEAAINASSCGTRGDHEHAGQMQDALFEARERAIEAICQLIEDERRVGG